MLPEKSAWVPVAENVFEIDGQAVLREKPFILSEPQGRKSAADG